MHIHKLFVQEYQVLQNFTLSMLEQDAEEINPGRTYKINLIVGVNGTGKSTLMHLLAELFQRLNSENRWPTFTFSITYTLHRDPNHPQKITISNRDEDRETVLPPQQERKQAARYYLCIDDGLPELKDNIDGQYLPDYIVVFSSGNQDNWELSEYFTGGFSHLDQAPPHKNDPKLQEKLRALHRREQVRTADPVDADLSSLTAIESSRFLCIKNQHLPLVILCGLLADTLRKDTLIMNDALAEVKIQGLRGFSLKFTNTSESPLSEDGEFIKQLRELSTYTVQNGDEQLLFFEIGTDLERIKQLIGIRGPQVLELFRKLNQLSQPSNADSGAFLRDIHLFFERTSPPVKEGMRKEQPPLHALTWLSDGELSFLGRLSLFSMLYQSEALVLLDEPEVHFNDYWKQQIISRLNHSLAESYSHVIMTTHSSITLSDVYDTDIHVFKRLGTFTSDAISPSISTLGTDPSDIVMQIFGAESATGAYGTEYIKQQLNRIYALEDREEKKERLDQLASRIGPSPWRYLIYREKMALGVQEKQ